VIGDFSARTHSNAVAVEDGHDTFSLASLGDVALYTIRGASLGVLALPGQVAVASLSGQAKSGDPVIALYGDKVLARRYHADQSDTSRATFACDQSGTEKVAPALTLPRNKVRVLPIVGVLYDSAPRSGSGEAQAVTECAVLGRPLLAARIVDDSGYPVIRSGDLVLLESVPLPDDAVLDQMKGDVVAFVASYGGERFSYLKRIGLSIKGGLRIFENVGTFGDSVAASCLCGEGNAGGGLEIQRMWKVHGVIRA
jgi:hypothetical protein